MLAPARAQALRGRDSGFSFTGQLTCLYHATMGAAVSSNSPVFYQLLPQSRAAEAHQMSPDKDLDVNIASNSPEHLRPKSRGEFQDDTEMEGLTLYEKKALLVNRELNSHGMGKYQWCIFFLCGFGYLVDLLYAQAFGLVEPAIQQEFGFGGTAIVTSQAP